MSGIYIPDMEIPELGFVEVRIHPDGRCETRDEADVLCVTHTAIPVPDHGRLIDCGELYSKVDAILTQILGYRDGEDARSQSFQSGAYYSIQKVKNALSNAPTIIPADKEVDE